MTNSTVKGADTLSSDYAYYQLYMKYKDVGPSFMFCFMSIILNIIVIPGIFMNISIIHITIKYKTLHGTSSFLLSLTAFYEIVHEFAHPIFLVVALSGCNFISYWTVFQLVAIPLWACSTSVITIAFTGFDRLVQLLYPKWHEQVNRKLYLGSMVFVSLFCGSLMAFKFWHTAADYPNYPQTGTISDIFLFEFKPLFFLYMGISNTLSILFYVAVGIYVRKQTNETAIVSKDCKTNSRLFKSLVAIVSVTIGAYLITALVRLVILPPFHLDQIRVWLIELSFGTLLNLGVALNAPVLYICSNEYRKCYNREFMLVGMLFGGSSPQTIVSLSNMARTTENREARARSHGGKLQQNSVVESTFNRHNRNIVAPSD